MQSIKPKLILMDIQLPGMDGIELTRKLKADPATGDILIVAVSAYAMKGDDQKAIQAGCDGYITSQSIPEPRCKPWRVIWPAKRPQNPAQPPKPPSAAFGELEFEQRINLATRVRMRDPFFASGEREMASPGSRESALERGGPEFGGRRG